MVNEHIARCLTLLDIRKILFKIRINTTTHLLKRLKLKRLMVPSVDEDVEELELSYTAGSNKTDTTPVERA